MAEAGEDDRAPFGRLAVSEFRRMCQQWNSGELRMSVRTILHLFTDRYSGARLPVAWPPHCHYVVGSPESFGIYELREALEDFCVMSRFDWHFIGTLAMFVPAEGGLISRSLSREVWLLVGDDMRCYGLDVTDEVLYVICDALCELLETGGRYVRGFYHASYDGNVSQEALMYGHLVHPDSVLEKALLVNYARGNLLSFARHGCGLEVFHNLWNGHIFVMGDEVKLGLHGYMPGEVFVGLARSGYGVIGVTSITGTRVVLASTKRDGIFFLLPDNRIVRVAESLRVFLRIRHHRLLDGSLRSFLCSRSAICTDVANVFSFDCDEPYALPGIEYFAVRWGAKDES